MECKHPKEELVLYLYGELDENESSRLEKHLADCKVCSHELESLSQVYKLLDQSNPDVWHKSNPDVWHTSFSAMQPSFRIYKYALGLAASLLLGVCMGWFGYSINSEMARNYKNTEQEKLRQEIVSLLAENQQYRGSISSAMRSVIVKMEKYLAQMGGISQEVQEIHAMEEIADSKNTARLIVRQKEFIKSHPDNLLAKTVTISLAWNLVHQKRYEEASGIYQALLKKDSMTVGERGECLWNLASCYKNNGRFLDYESVLEELEKEKVYGIFQLRAIKTLGDKDFQGMQFISARQRYQRCMERGLEESSDIIKRVRWIDFHEKDNFYPLMLFVQAQNKGVEGYYGLRMILSEYPESPLAFPAFEMYLQHPDISYPGMEGPFPADRNPAVLLPYLEHVAELEEPKEIVSFARYYLAHLWEKSGRTEKALEAYQKVLSEKSGIKLEEMALEASQNLKEKSSKTNERKDL